MDAEHKAQVTELHVPMDCRGCVHKIKRALHNLDGVYEVYIDVSQQKLTVVGRVDPEKIVKVIKRTRKTAVICPPPEPASSETPPPPPPEPAASTESATPAAAEAAPPPTEAPPAENPVPEVKPESESIVTAIEKPQNEDQIHMIHYYPQTSGYRERYRPEFFPHCVVQNYNGYIYTSSERHEFYGDGSYQSRQGGGGGGDGGQITSIFSDENPHACVIV